MNGSMAVWTNRAEISDRVDSMWSARRGDGPEMMDMDETIDKFPVYPTEVEATYSAGLPMVDNALLSGLTAALIPIRLNSLQDSLYQFVL